MGTTLDKEVQRQRENFDVIDEAERASHKERADLKKMSDGLNAIDRSLDKIIAQRDALLDAAKRYVELDDLWRQGKAIAPGARADLDIAFRDAIKLAEGR